LRGSRLRLRRASSASNAWDCDQSLCLLALGVPCVPPPPAVARMRRFGSAKSKPGPSAVKSKPGPSAVKSKPGPSAVKSD
jgi:hypothetical protein